MILELKKIPKGYVKTKRRLVCEDDILKFSNGKIERAHGLVGVRLDNKTKIYCAAKTAVSQPAST